MQIDYTILPDGTIDVYQDGAVINISQDELGEWDKLKIAVKAVPTLQKALVGTAVTAFVGGLLTAIWLRK